MCVCVCNIVSCVLTFKRLLFNFMILTNTTGKSHLKVKNKLYCVFSVKGGNFQLMFLVSVYVHILVSWPDDDPSLRSKLAAI